MTGRRCFYRAFSLAFFLITYGCGSTSGALSDRGNSDLKCFQGDFAVRHIRNIEKLRDYNCIAGNLYINTIYSNLSRLSHIRSIGGSLIIDGNPDLVTLDDLNNLLSIEGSITIINNASLLQCGVCDFVERFKREGRSLLSRNNKADLCNDACLKPQFSPTPSGESTTVTRQFPGIPESIEAIMNAQEAEKSNPAEARANYEKACGAGDSFGWDACVNLGVMLANGEGGPRDIERARNLFQEACSRGKGLGCYNLQRLP